MHVILAVSPKKVVKVLIVVVLCLLLANITTQYSRFYHQSTISAKFAPLFDVSAEETIPAWYQSSTLLLCALVLTIISWIKHNERAQYRVHWWGLAFIFLYLSMDEGAGLHDRMTDPVRRLLGVSGIFYFAWVIPAVVLVCVFAVAYLRFLLHLPRQTRWLIVLAAILYVGGAIGMEMVDGYYAATVGLNNLTYELMTTVEETCEMLGVIVFMYALLTYLKGYMLEVHVSFDDRFVLTRDINEQSEKGVVLR